MAYCVLVGYTVFFAFTYLKRVVYMAFLTIIAPLVAMTYSLDKISDGKAQAFNMWLKEYIFNLLIQPVHLLLYIVLISMAYDLAATNIIYTLVAIGFMIPAEKLVRKMFGIEGKASTPGLLGGAAGAAVAMNGVQKLAKLAGMGSGNKDGSKTAGKLNKGDDELGELYNPDKGFKDLQFGNDDDEKTDDKNNESNTVQKEGANNLPNGTQLPQTNKNPNIGLNEKGTEPTVKGINSPGGDNVPERPKGRIYKIRNKANQIKTRIAERAALMPESVKDGLKRAVSGGNAKQNIKGSAKTLKTGVRLTGAALGAMTGATLGIASGDIGKTFQNAAIGATAGTSIGNGIVGRTSGIKDIYKKTKIENDQNLYGNKYDEYKRKQIDAKFKKDAETRKYFERECATELEGLKKEARKEKLDQIMDQAIMYRQHGVTDNELIVKARRLNQGNPTSNESIGAAMLATKGKDIKGIDAYQKDLNKLWGEERAKRIVNDAKNLKGLL